MSEITEMSLSRPANDMLTSFYPTNIYDIITWCRQYERYNKFPCSIEQRFAIGFYQIAQGYNWKDGGVNKYEGYAAAVLHFFMVAERLELCIDSGLDIKLDEFVENELSPSIGREMLIRLSEAQQQVIYGGRQNKTKRKSRYDAPRLTLKLGKVIYLLISCIPVLLRGQAFEKASAIMTKELK